MSLIKQIESLKKMQARYQESKQNVTAKSLKYPDDEVVTEWCDREIKRLDEESSKIESELDEARQALA